MAANKKQKTEESVNSSLVAVRFLRGIGNYQQSDVAGFLPDRAKALIDNGFAEAYPTQGNNKCQGTSADPTS